MDHGPLIQQLRIERNLTQEQLAAGVSQRTTLSAFEKNGKNIRFNYLYGYLQKMNISLEEYNYLLDRDKNIALSNLRGEFRDRIKQPFDQQFADHLLAKYHSAGDFYYYGLYAQYYLLRARAGDALDTQLLKEIERNIKDYLDRIDTWGRFELVLFTNCLFLFNDNEIRFNFTDSLQRMQLFQKGAYYSSDLVKFLINGLQLSYERCHPQNIDLFTNELKKYARTHNDFRAQLISDAFTLLIDYRNGVDNQKEKKKIIGIFRYFEDDIWVDFINKEYRLGKVTD